MTAQGRSPDGGRTSVRDEDGGPIAGPGWPARGDGPLPDPLGLSHELRTPLTSILGNLELVLEGAAGPLSGAARACLTDIQAAGRRLEQRVVDLLLLLDIGERASLAKREPVDLMDLLCGAAAAAAGPAAPDVELVPRSLVLIVDGDPPLLRRMSRIIIDVAVAQRRGPIDAVVEPLPASPGITILRLVAPGLDPALMPPLDAALLAHILRLHGARGGWEPDVMRLEWPAAAG